jgi:defect-in-organelle-trafficking protein DotA
MIKLAKGLALVFILLLLPQIVLAQTNPLDQLGSFEIAGTKYYPSFRPVPTDLSVNYLGQVFGTVGTVLHGTSGQMLGQLFKVFNIGILVVAGVFLIYTIIMTILSTAHEGEFMGRKWNSAWIAIRTVLGLGLLVPSATTGYSTVQVVVMWVVLQGVGFANMAWYSALNYLKQGGTVYTPPSTDVSSMVNLAGTVLEMQICMYTAQSVTQNFEKNQQQMQQQQQQQNQATNTAAPTIASQRYVQDFRPLFTKSQPNPANNKTYSILMFPGNPYEADGQQDNACGQINFGSTDDSKADTLKAAVQQMVLDTDNYAQQIVQGYTSPNFPNQVQAAVVGAAADFLNVTLPIRSATSGLIDSLMDSFGQKALEQGWIMAGRYYYSLGVIQQQISSYTSVNVTIDAFPAGFDNSANTGAAISFTNKPKIDPSFTSGGTIKSTGQTQPGLTLFTSSDKNNLVDKESSGATFIVAANKTARAVDQSNNPINLNIGGAGILGFLLDPVTSFLYVIVGEFSNAVGDPILVLQGIGYGFMGLAATMWLVGTVSIFGLGTAVSSLASVQPVGYGVEDAILAFIPTFTVFILLFYVLGATFAFYIPLVPFIIFVFSAIGWMIAVIEAMVAAPLVALGITHPEGHELMGKSEQAIMLLLSVFLRPVLMVIGLIAGMILSKVVLRFLNSGFFGIVFDVGDFNLFAFAAVLVIYCMLLVTIVNQSFSLIYIIPDRVMRWLGVSEQTTGAQEALQAAKQGFEQISGGTEKLAASGQSTAVQWKEKQMKRQQDYDELNKGRDSTSARGGN